MCGSMGRCVVLLGMVLCVSILKQVTCDASIECYECVEGVDAGCQDPFNNETIKPTDCGNARARPHVEDDEHRAELKYTKAVGCRKILQEIDEKTHVVRQCAYSGENVGGLKRVGNKGVRLFYYQCADSLCNGAGSSRFYLLTLISCVCAVAFFVNSRAVGQE